MEISNIYKDLFLSSSMKKGGLDFASVFYRSYSYSKLNFIETERF